MNKVSAVAVPQDFSPTLVALMLIVISLLTPFAMDGYTPSLPALTHALNCTENQVQLTISLFLLGSAVSQLFYGPLSDRFGRRNVVLVGMSICVLGGVLCSTAKSIEWLIMARFIEGAGAGAANTLYRAIMRDIYSGTRLAQMASRMSVLYTMGWAVAPVLGGYIQQEFNWRGNLIFAAGYALIATLFISRFLPETNFHLSQNATRLRVILQNYKTLLTDNNFLGNVICSSLTLSGIITYIAMAPFLLQNTLGLTPAEYGWTVVALAAGLGLGNFLNGALVVRHGTQRLLIIGLCCMTISGAVLSLTGLIHLVNIFAIVMPAFCFAASAGLVYANAMSGAFQRFPHIAGAGAAVYGCLQMLGTFLTSLWVVELRDDNQATMGLVFFSVGILAVLTYGLLLRKKEN